MSDFDNFVDSDLGASFEQLHLEIRLANRIKCDGWDGKPRKCKSCGREVEIERLKLINATQCRACVQPIDENEDE